MTTSFNRNQLNSKNHASRTLKIESLENRELLSVVSPFASADNLTENVSAYVSTIIPSTSSLFPEMNLEIPLPPQSSPTRDAPFEVTLDKPLVQSLPKVLSASNTNLSPIVTAPLEVNLDAPIIQAAPTLNASAATATKIVVNTVDDTVNSDRYTSLREAIQKAADGAVITFASSMKGKTIYLSSTLNISKNITIDASSIYDSKNDEPGLIIRMSSSNYMLNINAKNVTIKGVEFSSSSGNAGGIYCYGRTSSVLNVQKCHFHNLEVACGFQGDASSATANIDSCKISSISSFGLVNSTSGRMNITNCTLSNCSYMGVVNSSGGIMKIENSSLFSSTYTVDNSGTLTISHSTVSNNSGGCIISNDEGGSVYIDNSLFENNKPGTYYNTIENSGFMSVTNVTFVGNNRTFANWGTMYLRNSIGPTDNYGSKTITRTNCLTRSQADLDSNNRPLPYSSCIDGGSNSYASYSSKDLAGSNRILGNRVDIGCYEYLPVYAWSESSGKTKIYWEDSGAESYTVQYRPEGTEKWTTRTVKNKTELSISVKNNVFYEVVVTPKGASANMNQSILAGAVAKLGARVTSKTDDSISFKLTNIASSMMDFSVGIKSQYDGSYRYYTVYQYNSGSMGSLRYTFYDDVLTISGLNSNTKYNFQFNQSIGTYTAYACSPTTNVSAATTKAKYNTPSIKSFSATSNGVTLNWNSVYGKNSSIPAQKYTVQYAVQGTNQWKTATTSATGNSFTVKNLKSGTQYKFRICATKDSYFETSLYSNALIITTK